MGKKPNYKAKLLLDVIEEVKPSGSVKWQEVAEKYKARSQEPDTRDWQDMRRYFNEKLCEKNRKPTGESQPKPQVARAQAIYEQILRLEGAGIYGSDSEVVGDDVDDEDNEDDNEDDDIGEVVGIASAAAAGGGGGGVGSDEGSLIAIIEKSSPRRASRMH